MKCLIIARVSTEIQTLDSQIEKLTDEAKRLGYSEYTIVSGKESGVKLDIEERQTIQEMKKHIETGQYDMVIIWEVSRLARRPKVLYEVKEYLINHKVNLHCITPQFTMLKEDGTIDPTAALVFGIFGTLAEEEARMTKERMSRGKKHKQALGGYIGGKPLFGYKFENDRLCIDYSKSEIVKKIYDMYESGLSSVSIAKELMQTGEIKQTILNNANRQVQIILSREEYYGGSSGLSGYKYPPIITKTQFDKCRSIASDKSREHSTVKKVCLCKKLIYFDGHLLSPNIAKGQYKLCLLGTKSNATINISRMDEIAWNTVSGVMKDDEVDKTQIEKEAYTALRKIQQSMRNIKSIEEQIDRIERRIIEGKMSEIKGDNMIQSKKAEIEEQQSIYDLNSYIYSQKNMIMNEKTYKKDIAALTDTEKQAAVRKYISKIVLEKCEKRGRYKITLHMKDSSTYVYEYYSSGPWNHYKLADV